MESTQTYRTFSTLFSKGAQVNKIVAGFSFNPAQYRDEKTLKKALVDLGIAIANELERKKVENVEPEVRDLMSFFMNIKVDEEFFDCKEPLGKGDTGFNDIAGLHSVKDQLRMNYIYPFRYPLLFPSIAKGVLLYGPPGTGKTLMARAATAELPDAAFFSPTPGELRGKYEGETEKNIHQVFACAEQIISSPTSISSYAIIFFDEFDSIAGKRGEDPSMTRSVNALLQAMDGIKKRPNVSVVAATNYPDSLDDAILRRFTTRIFVDLPDPEARDYLIREPLALAYSTPDMSTQERKDSATKRDPNAPYLRNIRKLGKFTGTTQLPGGRQMTDKYIDDSYISMLVQRFGPQQPGQDIINSVSLGKDIPLTDPRLNTPQHIFGYSPSDITKIMELAIKFAGTRALLGYAQEVKEGDIDDTYYPRISLKSSEIEKSDLTPIEKRNAKLELLNRRDIVYYVYDNALGQGNKIDSLESDKQKRVLNFDIRQSDVERALMSLASTVDNVKYLTLLKYAKQP